ncbi:transglycosylase SLT domain-containing protein [Pseudochelatococcus contaminans]|uniref:Soluble lytic murein transglycosylase-like protein n=1 Tax=Pseudochelatococcus contaminans TaxID=1538103 RepID=A0A7W6EFR7_9HYPH|nr:transglycosylase SLT domain-containing protein [Pseudochelatococcus contaminans]MBB3808925.1 soluble lytic murein transglycosylase-like protein [Pseudochelatococcus contaminans]
MRFLLAVIGSLLLSPAAAQNAPATGEADPVVSAPEAKAPETPQAAVADISAQNPAPDVPQPAEASSSAGEAAPSSRAQGRDTYRKILREKAAALGVPFELADAVTEVESSYNRGAVGGVGEVGLMQVLPSTARMLGFSGTLAELAVPETNIHYGVTYLAQAWRLGGQDICTAVMKYRAGHGETRFSHLSVDYCIKVRRGLTVRGYTVTGEVPKATFGAPVGGGVRVAGRTGKKSRLNWKAADARWREVTGKVNSANLMIMQ